MPRSIKPSQETLAMYSEEMKPGQYEHYIKQHNKRILDDNKDVMRRLTRGGRFGNAPANQLARAAGVHPGTVIKYRKGEWGSRGPLFRTVRALMLAQGILRI